MDELKAYLGECCLEDRDRKSSGKRETIFVRFEQDKAAALPLPKHAFEASVRQEAKVDKYQFARFDNVCYSVPRASEFQTVTVKGFVDRVEIVHQNVVVAVHHELEITVFRVKGHLPLAGIKTIYSREMQLSGVGGVAFCCAVRRGKTRGEVVFCKHRLHLRTLATGIVLHDRRGVYFHTKNTVDRMTIDTPLGRALVELRQTVDQAERFEIDDFRRLIFACQRVVDQLSLDAYRELQRRSSEWNRQISAFTRLSEAAYEQFQRICSRCSHNEERSVFYLSGDGSQVLLPGLAAVLWRFNIGDAHSVFFKTRSYAILSSENWRSTQSLLEEVASDSELNADDLNRWFDEFSVLVLKQERDRMISSAFLLDAHKASSTILTPEGFDLLRYRFATIWGECGQLFGQDLVSAADDLLDQDDCLLRPEPAQDVVMAAEVLSATSDQNHRDSYLRSDANTSALSGTSDPPQNQRTGASLPPEPSRKAIMAYQLMYVIGIKTQGEIAKEMTRQGERATQGQVSRWLKEAKDFREAGGYIRDPESDRRCETSIDPNDLEIGPRIDGRTPRQRPRRNDE